MGTNPSRRTTEKPVELEGKDAQSPSLGSRCVWVCRESLGPLADPSSVFCESLASRGRADGAVADREPQPNRGLETALGTHQTAKRSAPVDSHMQTRRPAWTEPIKPLRGANKEIEMKTERQREREREKLGKELERRRRRRAVLTQKRLVSDAH